MLLRVSSGTCVSVCVCECVCSPGVGAGQSGLLVGRVLVSSPLSREPEPVLCPHTLRGFPSVFVSLCVSSDLLCPQAQNSRLQGLWACGMGYGAGWKTGEGGKGLLLASPHNPWAFLEGACPESGPSQGPRDWQMGWDGCCSLS